MINFKLLNSRTSCVR